MSGDLNMKLPFPYFLANTYVEVWFCSVDSDGEYQEEIIYSGKCIYTDKTKQILDAERRLVTLSGTVTVPGRISQNIIEGYVKINGMKKAIYSSNCPLNPDGTVFSTELNLS